MASLDLPYAKRTLDNGLDVIVHEDHAVPIVAGGSLAGVLLYWQYSHAKASGLAKAADGAPPTEQSYR